MIGAAASSSGVGIFRQPRFTPITRFMSGACDAESSRMPQCLQK